MRVGVDAHQLNGKPQGIRTYLIQLIRHLAPLLDASEVVLAYSYEPESSERILGVQPVQHRRMFPRRPQLRVPVVVPALEIRDRLDVFHSQYVCPPLSPAAEVVSIHDILFETHPELFIGAMSRMSQRLIRLSAERARFVLTGSRFSREMLLDHYGLPDEKVVAIPDGVDLDQFHPVDDPEIRDRVCQRYGLERPFVLSVGRLEPRKNLERLVRAFWRVHRGVGGETRLVLAGAPDFGFDGVRAEAAKLPQGTVRFLGPVPDEDLPALYSLAAAFAYPSLVEGFGMPVLEAMACGAPVVTSRRGALDEVAGEAALFVEPEEEESIASALETVLTVRGRAEELRGRGFARARQFPWEETARRTLEVYRRCAGAWGAGLVR